MKTYNVQMHGLIRFYFPEFPNHPLNFRWAIYLGITKAETFESQLRLLELIEF